MLYFHSGPLEYLDYPSLVQNVTCCDPATNDTTCGAAINFRAIFLGEVTFKICDTHHTEKCVNQYSVGVIRPAGRVQDKVSDITSLVLYWTNDLEAQTITAVFVGRRRLKVMAIQKFLVTEC